MDPYADMPDLMSDPDSNSSDVEVLPARRQPPPLPWQMAPKTGPYADLLDLISDPDSDIDDEPPSRRLAAVHIYPDDTLFRYSPPRRRDVDDDDDADDGANGPSNATRASSSASSLG